MTAIEVADLLAADDLDAELPPDPRMRELLFEIAAAPCGALPDHELLPEDTEVGPYRIRDLLGRGGMGAVFRAKDERLHRDVALKLLPLGAGEGARARFLREARVLAAAHHPRMPAVFEAGEDGPRAYL